MPSTEAATTPNLKQRALDAASSHSSLFDAFLQWATDHQISLYPAQEEAILEIFDDNHVILNTPTGSGKSLVALAMHFRAFASQQLSVYTSPIKALVTEKFFDLCHHFEPESVGLLTGDATVNPKAPILCCTQEILASFALRYGDSSPVRFAIIDEFHYYADRERGTSWQIPLLSMPNTTFMLMSATIGDPSLISNKLHSLSQRPVSLVQSDQRPVPLSYHYSTNIIVHEVQRLISKNLFPVYVVNFSQRETADLAQSLMSLQLSSSEEKNSIKNLISDITFDTPYGHTVKRYLQHGVALHHGGLIPKYRRAVERLAQQGLLKVISGTDTLGVGINLPLRTVLFSKLCKFDGQRVHRLKVRDFKQIAGRAGRKGFDDQGLVVCQAPEYVIENLRIDAKVAENPGKAKKLKKVSPPSDNFVDWNEDTFLQLANGQPEPLVSRFNVSHAMLLELMQRPHNPDDPHNNGFQDLLQLIERSHESDASKERLRDKATMILNSLIDANIIVQDPQNPDSLALHEQLQDDFSIHHSLSLFLIDIASRLNLEHPDYHLSILSYVEAILEDPRVVLYKQQDKARDEAYRQMKSQFIEYDERQEKLKEITYPMPLKDEIHETFMLFSQLNPWISGYQPSPKSVARDMYERYVSFNSYIKTNGLERSEGVLLRYLSQVLKTLKQNIPDEFKNERLLDAIAYIREVVARTDSSIIDEWSTLRDGGTVILTDPLDDSLLPLDSNPDAFRARVRAEIRSLVEALSLQDYEEASGLVRQMPGAIWTPSRFETQLQPFYNEYTAILFDHHARNPSFTTIKRIQPSLWSVSQILCDPQQDNFWFLSGRIEVPQPPIPEDFRLFILEHIGQ